jgi:hypothetical protein
MVYRVPFGRRLARSLRALIRRLIPLGVLALALYTVWAWGLAPLVKDDSATPPARAGTAAAKPPTRAAGITPGLARPSVEKLPIAILDASGRGGATAAAERLRGLGFTISRRATDTGVTDASVLAYAPGWKRRAQLAAADLGVPVQPGGKWLGPLRGRPLVLVVGRH